MVDQDYSYIGNELELLAEATNWKRYYTKLVTPHIKGKRILEVGAGIGEITKCLSMGGVYDQWLSLEPDKEMSGQISSMIENGELPGYCNVDSKFLSELEKDDLFDTILYIDVLEHVEYDRLEIISALAHLKEKGCIIVVSPAHNWLYTPWDKAIGHFRRYNRTMLKEILPSGMNWSVLRYIDSIGLFASLANKLFLKQSNPNKSQILFWDKVLVPLSRIFDKIFFYKFGKNIIAVLNKEDKL